MSRISAEDAVEILREELLMDNADEVITGQKFYGILSRWKAALIRRDAEIRAREIRSGEDASECAAECELDERLRGSVILYVSKNSPKGECVAFWPDENTGSGTIPGGSPEEFVPVYSYSGLREEYVGVLLDILSAKDMGKVVDIALEALGKIRRVPHA